MRVNQLRKSRAAKAVVTAAAMASLATLAIGLLHLPWARSWLPHAFGCPVGRATPAQVEAAQARAFRSLCGPGHARSRPALGFTLERTTLAEVQQWAHERGLACEVRRDGALLICPAVPASGISTRAPFVYDELAFGFRLRDLRLVNLTTLRTGLDRQEAGLGFQGLKLELAEKLGEPALQNAGENPFVNYRFADYLAEVSAMPLPRRGYALREHYMSALE
jgi:hypothetical protein